MKFCAGMGRLTSNSRLNVAGDLDHNANIGIFKQNCYHCGINTIVHNCNNWHPTPQIMTTILMGL